VRPHAGGSPDAAARAASTSAVDAPTEVREFLAARLDGPPAPELCHGGGHPHGWKSVPAHPSSVAAARDGRRRRDRRRPTGDAPPS
jgi:hypothetical protein